MAKLGVNVDHIATLREARKGVYPDPIQGALICQAAGCHSIVAHLREDKRHIKDTDVKRLKNALKIRFNLEMSIAKDIVNTACRIKPDQATLVPEKRQELTTEGGLDITSNKRKLVETIKRLKNNGIEVSLFIDPNQKQISQALKVGANIIELHTGEYANTKPGSPQAREEEGKIIKAVKFAKGLGLVVCAGHGLDYNNVTNIANIKDIEELNIGYSIICRSLFSGLDKAVKQMLNLIR